MLRYLVVLGAFMWLTLPAATVWSIEVVDATITTAVVDRAPVDQVKAFPTQNGKLYCFTSIVGSESPTEVYHAWFHGERLMSRVKLPVNSPDWRTWSAKSFLEDWLGAWHVEIQDVDGNVLHEVNFQIR